MTHICVGDLIIIGSDNTLSPCRRQATIWTNARRLLIHYDDVIMDAIASQITSLTIVYSTIYTDVDQRKHQSSASQAFVWGIHRGPVNSPHKWPVTRKMFPFDDVIMWTLRNKLQWYFNRNSYIFAFENVVCEMAAILSRPQCVDL